MLKATKKRFLINRIWGIHQTTTRSVPDSCHPVSVTRISRKELLSRRFVGDKWGEDEPAFGELSRPGAVGSWNRVATTRTWSCARRMCRAMRRHGGVRWRRWVVKLGANLGNARYGEADEQAVASLQPALAHAQTGMRGGVVGWSLNSRRRRRLQPLPSLIGRRTEVRTADTKNLGGSGTHSL